MSNDIPVSVHQAWTPEAIQAAAKELEKVDSLAALEPLAELDRRAPGWVFIELGLIARTLAAFITGSLAALALGYVVATLGTILLGLTQTFYPEHYRTWWLAWVGLVALALWRDRRWRGLLDDSRFDLPRTTFTWLGAGLLWPLRILARTGRLLVAGLFLTGATAPVLFGLWTLAAVVGQTDFHGDTDQDTLRKLGLSAAALLLTFGLFVFSEWPSQRSEPKPPPTARTIGLRFVTALAWGAGLGWLVWQARPELSLGPGVVSGVFFCGLFSWYFAARTPLSPLNLKWLAGLRHARITQGQIRFGYFLIGLLAFLGLGCLVFEVVIHWEALQATTRLWLILLEQAALSGPIEPAAWPLVTGLALSLGLSFLAALHLTGLSLLVARPAAWPFFWLRSALFDLLQRLRARLAVRDAIRLHKQRNLQRVGLRGDLAVCREHLARFERKEAQLSYGRRWAYWRCRVCGKDDYAFTSVRTLQGVFDETLREPIAQSGSVLRVNLATQSPMPLDLQEVVVTSVDHEHAVEAFVAAYQNYVPPVKTPRLKDIPLRIEGQAALSENTERLLRRTFRT
jgi:hypothetical protein